ncbi:MAG: DUF2911 domain-containing protein [Flavobacteriales bacterium]|nr:DUF2911 domain-containing protein [Flavobacteriales bacterium]
MKQVMISAVAILSVFAFSYSGLAQEKAPKSPAKSTETLIDGVNVLVVYGSPSVREREIWGKLVPYNKVWRTGANEATTIEVHADMEINGKLLPEGKYSIFTIPTEKSWTLIFNSVWEQWGAYKYDESKDVLRVEATPEKCEMTESMSIRLDNSQLTIKWEKLKVSVKISKAK